MSSSTITYTSVYSNSEPWRFQWVCDDEIEAPEEASLSPGQTPPSPNYVPGPEHPSSPDYVPGLEYPEYLVPSDDEEDPEEDPADYPADGGDDDDDDEDVYKFNLDYVASIKWEVELSFNAHLFSSTRQSFSRLVNLLEVKQHVSTSVKEIDNVQLRIINQAELKLLPKAFFSFCTAA
ncbi:hypothetical protein Tco_0035317 [Tanacetum coccineum]